jgi:hypothetical protein
MNATGAYADASSIDKLDANEKTNSARTAVARGIFIRFEDNNPLPARLNGQGQYFTLLEGTLTPNTISEPKGHF